MTSLDVRSLHKSYGSAVAVNNFTHAFAPGQITSVVGPSGSGKSTMLWMIAGLTRPEAGSIWMDGLDVTSLLPEKRDIGMVFQNYALFPHLTVAENVEFGLRVRGLSREERRRRAADTLGLVRIAHLGGRRVNQISGGEQQRVALARALAIRPRVLLMDEPLSALDAKLRDELRTELFRLLRELQITTVYVTHDQVEAMSLANQLIVMNQGAIEQAGAPLEVYRRPASTFVAEFLGSANIVEGVCGEVNGRRVLRLPFAELDASDAWPAGHCWVLIRPEDMTLSTQGEAHFHASFESSLFLGNQVRVHLNITGRRLIVDVQNEFSVQGNVPVPVQIRADKIFVWPRERAGLSLEKSA